MNTRKTLSKLFVVVALVAIAAVWFSARKAQAISSFSMSSGMVGITQGQTARLNVVNAFSTDDVQVELTIFDSGGKVQIQCNLLIAPGKSLSDDFTPQGLGQGERLELRALVRVLDKRQADDIGVTLEIFNSETGANNSIYEFRPVFNPPTRFF